MRIISIMLWVTLILNMHRSKEKKHKYTKEDEDIYIAVV